MAEYDDRLRAADRNAPNYERTRETTYDPTRDVTYDTTRTTTYVERPQDVRDDARYHQATVGSKNILDWLSILLLIVGGLNWGLVGLFGIDVVASIFGPGSMISRVIYIAVGVAAIWGFALTRLGPTRHH
jgi:uncharacterized membrane protein YuzA (DUF378 family)